jgi:hypothetical protein
VELEADPFTTTFNVGRHLGVQRVHCARSDLTAIRNRGLQECSRKLIQNASGLYHERSFDYSNQLPKSIRSSFGATGIGMAETRQLEMSGSESFGIDYHGEEAGLKPSISSSNMR